MRSYHDTFDLWKNADSICFDVDSTVCRDEAIDEMARYKGVYDQVQDLTKSAMGGQSDFRESLKARLEIINMSKQELDDFIAKKVIDFSEGVEELITRLQSRGVHVYLISGGFRSIISPIAKKLCIPDSRVFANTLLFEEDGSYKGFDYNEFTSESGGKANAVLHIRMHNPYKTLVMIGDGATDLEAKQVIGGADLFIGYGGVHIRPKTLEESDWFITNFVTLLHTVPIFK